MLICLVARELPQDTFNKKVGREEVLFQNKADSGLHGFVDYQIDSGITMNTTINITGIVNFEISLVLDNSHRDIDREIAYYYAYRHLFQSPYNLKKETFL